MVEDLLERNARQPIVVLATARPALAERWSPPEGGHHAVTVHVDPLDRDAATQVLHLLAADKTVALDDAVVAELLDRAGGNPLFLEELVSWLEEARSTELPDTLRGLVAARLDGLTAQERLVLEDAAVLGSSGHVEWLATMHREAHGGDGAVRSVLGGLQVKDLVALEGESWEFRSEVVREVTYGTMTKERRAKVHAGIAWWLEREERPHHDAVVDRIAHHYARAATLAAELGGSAGVPRDVGARAVRWLRSAGDRATQADTPRRAARLYSEALTALDNRGTDAATRGVPADTDDRIAILLARSAAYAELRDVGPARADADAARALADAAGDEQAAVRATVAVAEAALRSGSPDEAEALLDEALARAEAAGDDEGRATALRVRGFAALLCNDPDTAIASLEPARELYAALGDRRGLAWALQNLSWAHFVAGRIDDAETLLHESAALFADLGDRGGLGWALGLLAFTRFHSGYPDEAETMAEQVFSGAEAAGDRWAVGMGQVLTASIRLWTGRAESAIERAREALATFDAIDDDYGRVQARLPLGRALVTAGRVAEGFERVGTGPRIAAPEPLTPVHGVLGDRPPERRGPGRRPRSGHGGGDRPARPDLVRRPCHRRRQRAPRIEGLAGAPARPPGRGARPAAASWTAPRGSAAPSGTPGPSPHWPSPPQVGSTTRSPQPRGWRVTTGRPTSTARGRGWPQGPRPPGAVDRAAVDARFPELCARVDATDDRIAQAVVRLAWAMALEVVGDAAAASLLDDSSARFAKLGIDPGGWAAVVRQAVGMTPAEPAPA